MQVEEGEWWNGWKVEVFGDCTKPAGGTAHIQHVDHDNDQKSVSSNHHLELLEVVVIVVDIV